jgi:hypothetical protein
MSASSPINAMVLSPDFKAMPELMEEQPRFLEALAKGRNPGGYPFG